MSFYDLSKEQRKRFILRLESAIAAYLAEHNRSRIITYASDKDTYIRRQAYLFLGRLFKQRTELQAEILALAKEMLVHPDEKVRQTAVYLAGEIEDFGRMQELLEIGLKDRHHSVRNGVIGALKQLGQKRPQETLAFARRHLHNTDPEVRRAVIHGIELRGRTHPRDVLPLLRELQDDPQPRVRLMLIHILGQISYKKGCLQAVASELKTWGDRELVKKAIKAILKVHSEQGYCALSLDQAKSLIAAQLGKGFPDNKG